MEENPYLALAQRYKEVERIKKETEALVYQYHDDFLKVFIQDDSNFDALLTKAKVLQKRKGKKRPNLNKIYYEMALIYQKWIPIEDLLLEKNPLYKDLFKGLKAILDDIDA